MAALEFALAAPIVAVLGLAMMDVVDFLRAWLRIERTAGEIAHVIAQYEVVREADFAVVFDLARRIASPYRVTQEDGAVIVSGIANTGQGLTVLWQRRAGSPGYASAFGTEGGPATIPASSGDLFIASGQGAVVTEVFLSREPWLLSGRFLASAPFSRLSSFAVQRPRMVSILRVSGT